MNAPLSALTTVSRDRRPVVFVVDDNEDVLTTLVFVLERQGFAARACRTADELFSAEVAPACALIDWRLGEQDGMEIAARCRRERPSIAVILISGAATVSTAVQAMRMGIASVLQKPIEPIALAEEVRAAIRNHEARGTLAEEQSVARLRVDNLGAREREILELVAQGTPNKRIATRMSLALRTVEKRRRQLFDALEVDSAAEATRLYVLAALSR